MQNNMQSVILADIDFVCQNNQNLLKFDEVSAHCFWTQIGLDSTIYFIFFLVFLWTDDSAKVFQ